MDSRSFVGRFPVSSKHWPGPVAHLRVSLSSNSRKFFKMCHEIVHVKIRILYSIPPTFSRSYMYTSVGTPLSRVVFRCPRLYLLDYSSNQRMPMCQGDRNGSKGEFWDFIRGTQRFFFGFLGWDLFLFKNWLGDPNQRDLVWHTRVCLRFEGVTFCWRRSSCCRISFTAGSKTWFSRGIWSQ